MIFEKLKLVNDKGIDLTTILVVFSSITLVLWQTQLFSAICFTLWFLSAAWDKWLATQAVKQDITRIEGNVFAIDSKISEASLLSAKLWEKVEHLEKNQEVVTKIAEEAKSSLNKSAITGQYIHRNKREAVQQ